MRFTPRSRFIFPGCAAVLGLTAGLLALGSAAPVEAATATPIQHVIVIFQENVSFDHYFATYPGVNGLTAGLLFHNPNSVQPFLLTREQNYTCDQDHDYTPEQQAVHGGAMDRFVENTGTGAPGCLDYGHGTGLTMGYYDGTTVTALWNYARHFSLSDNSFGTTYGPSTPGAVNLVSGQTGTVDAAHSKGTVDTDTVIGTSVIGDPDPYYDDCGAGTQIAMNGKNVGDLLNAAGVTWGWFQGGFAPSGRDGSGNAVCGAKTPNLSGAAQADYSAHHEPFEYYLSTSNPHHLPPSSVAMIGHTDAANHQYDLADFWNAVKANNLPAVSFLKAKKSQDGHAGYSSPLDEQVFLTQTLNALQKTAQWKSTAVFILWDDSDGWYDHVMAPLISPSGTSLDALTGAGACGDGSRAIANLQGRCGYGPRLPLLVISPWARANYVDHTVTDQTSPLSFIEDNWHLPRIGGGSFDGLAGSLYNMFDFSHHPRTAPYVLDPGSGEPTAHP